MTEYEMLRIIDFLNDLNGPFGTVVPDSRGDPIFALTLSLMQAHLTGRDITKSALAESGGVPFVTAMRHISQMIDDGHIMLDPRTSTGRSFYVRPSAELMERFTTYCRGVKATIGRTFGTIDSIDDVDGFYFGGSNFSRVVIPPPRLQTHRASGGKELRFLFRKDNYFEALRNTWADLRSNVGSIQNVDLLPLPHLYDRIIENGGRATSEFDVICVNKPWVGDLVNRGLVRPLDDLIGQSHVQPLDFSPMVWESASWQGAQYGVPIYTTVELFLARQDVFERSGIAYPRTFDQVIEAGRALQRPEEGLYGVAWNGARGMPVANTFMVLLGSCNSACLNLPRRRIHTPMHDLVSDKLRAQLLTDQAFEVLDYMHRLKEVSHPDVLAMDWDRRVDALLTGKAVMGYCWSMHAALMEYHVKSVVSRRMRYLEQPKGKAGMHANPVGGFHLMIPSNLAEDRVQLAFDAISWMCSPEVMKEHVSEGFPVAPRFSVAADPEAAASSPVMGVVDRLLRSNSVCTWSRPAVPEFHGIETILGEEIHAALRGDATDREALERAQRRIDDLLRVRNVAAVQGVSAQ
ncbi:extracellular solute-binding protein [Sulfitobacter sp. G21635-S1]|jgi:multiple sugar transport system substrate-binding protein|uniref:extracellular solute-binding protein n=1 Tax=Sulfitobacter sp. G21635-S1 TaxID=3014043 RepID=UPI0022AFCBA2|nr:extracellular solute-binding protein [Sulfitobacter sp. G21635-S1]MCZ4254198.1 extracellular solute-binding protein [Sulfitobacter sp. G21635-S1]